MTAARATRHACSTATAASLCCCSHATCCTFVASTSRTRRASNFRVTTSFRIRGSMSSGQPASTSGQHNTAGSPASPSGWVPSTMDARSGRDTGCAQQSRHCVLAAGRRISTCCRVVVLIMTAIFKLVALVSSFWERTPQSLQATRNGSLCPHVVGDVKIKPGDGQLLALFAVAGAGVQSFSSMRYLVQYS